MFRLLAILLLVATAPQPTAPAHVAEFPSIERVKREISGKDEEDTAARQAAVFWQLREMLYDIALSQHRDRNSVTPDEKRLADAYYTARYYAFLPIEKDKATRISTPEGRLKFFALNNLGDNPGIKEEIIKRFFSPALATLYLGTDAIFAARHQEYLATQARATAEEDKAANKGAPERAVARCLAAGRSAFQCVGVGVGEGLNELVAGIDPSLVKKTVPGLRMGGAYPGPNGFGVRIFGPNAVLLGCRGVAEFFDYTLIRRGSDISINVVGPDQTVVLTMRPDGTLDGARQQITVADTYEAGSTVERTPGRGTLTTHYMSTRRERCTIGVLGPGVQPDEGFIGAFLDKSQQSVNGSPLIKASPGLRMGGSYGDPAKFNLEFFNESVIVGCANALIAEPYTVERKQGQFFITIQHAGSPIVLTASPDGTLQGSGAITVQGRVLAGQKSNGELAFRPLVGSCSITAVSPAG
jgi:hypothetical protein